VRNDQPIELNQHQSRGVEAGKRKRLAPGKVGDRKLLGGPLPKKNPPAKYGRHDEAGGADNQRQPRFLTVGRDHDQRGNQHHQVRALEDAQGNSVPAFALELGCGNGHDSTCHRGYHEHDQDGERHVVAHPRDNHECRGNEQRRGDGAPEQVRPRVHPMPVDDTVDPGRCQGVGQIDDCDGQGEQAVFSGGKYPRKNQIGAGKAHTGGTIDHRAPECRRVP